jgi:hypothetical protein
VLTLFFEPNDHIRAARLAEAINQVIAEATPPLGTDGMTRAKHLSARIH